MKQAAAKIEVWPIGKLRRAEYNPRVQLTPEDKEAEFTVRTDEGEQKYTVNAETRIETELMLKPGENRITITSGAPDLEVEGDIRKLNFKVIQMEILMGDEQMDLMNLPSRE